ncbi:MAG: S8/S53 family peptidase [Ferruginibacter sp.]|nr:S8/S53 family peptidase [Ferruginibacter sp.]
MNRIIQTVSITLLLSILISSCMKTIPKGSLSFGKEPIPRQQIDAMIKESLYQNKSFDWKKMDAHVIWSALQHSDKIMSIGYKPLTENNVEQRLDVVDINQLQWKEAKKNLLDLILNAEKKTNDTLILSSILIWEDHVLPVINIKVENPETVALLLSSNYVRYAEPMGYEPQHVLKRTVSDSFPVYSATGGSGCDGNAPQYGLVEGVDYQTIFPATKQSWNYVYHNIPRAWSLSTGAGIKVFFIDTGCGFDQENLGNAFNQGSSSKRTVEKIVTFPRATFLGIPTGSVETPEDDCGHGTSMAGVCAAPRGTDGNACGVAYNCNLVTCRASDDVYLDASREVKGVVDAFVNAGSRSDVRIISMSMGRITSSSQIRDAILFAYQKGKLIFCAAGTSFSWTSGWAGVIFPASMPEVNAVTGVKDNNFFAGCDNCHEGSETDFTIVMEKSINGRKPLSLAMRGDIPSTVGGSSVSTATAAGIAALVWSRFPTFTRDQILNKLITSSANYPRRNVELGWGNMNAYLAVQ